MAFALKELFEPLHATLKRRAVRILPCIQCVANQADFRLPAAPWDSQSLPQSMLFYWGKSRNLRYYCRSKRRWCGRVDSNHHGIVTASSSSWCSASSTAPAGWFSNLVSRPLSTNCLFCSWLFAGVPKESVSPKGCSRVTCAQYCAHPWTRSSEHQRRVTLLIA